MHVIKQASGEIIANDTRASVAAIDQAVLSYSRLCSSIVEVSTSSDLPVSAAQNALAKVVDGLTAAIKGREDISQATRELLKVQKASSLETISYGCPDGFPPKTAEKIEQPTAQSAR